VRVGINLLLWTAHVGEGHLPLLAALAALGYDGVEVPIHEGPPGHYAALGARLDAMGLARTASHAWTDPAIDPLSDDPSRREAAVAHATRIVDAAGALGASVLCGPLHSVLGRFSGAGPTAVELERAVAFHRAVGDAAARAGTRLALEAVNRFECYLLNTMSDLAAHCDRVGHPSIRAMYDTFHANIEERDPVAAIEAAARHMIHVHVSENDRGIPGRGHVPFGATFGALKRVGYDGFLTIEAFGRALPAIAAATRVWRDLFPDPMALCREGLAFVRDGWARA
jgi:D-psicose/D-tagatose/L-ribulose 3-epimerase